ncbi:uncharacterized protein YciI [Tamaricihabitans halophyticus]|uniref:Uncharacterized protein YciI n=1 Tax=Tamaricihabitans halophyticus TaxID=1262583 RepID=A0A4R2R9B3_9PSEU|nr:YciI family protein [Tamaricihabitans halophyticus]TCP56251.1 uncharacterized protein YciI [Tamaricihabitans halophyticus]
MYVVVITYTAPLQEVDFALPDHAEWLAKQYGAGLFLASGRRETHNGDVILTCQMSRGKLDAVLATDPFALQHLARHEVIGFDATRTAHELASFNEARIPAPH